MNKWKRPSGKAMNRLGERVGEASRGIGEMLRETGFNPARSVGMKLFLIIFCGILVCVVSLGLFSLSRSSSIIQQKVADSSAATMEQTAARLDQLLRIYEQKTMEFIANQNFINNLTTFMSPSTTDFERYEAQRAIGELFGTVQMSDVNVAGVYIVPNDEKTPVIGSTAGSVMPEKAALLEQPFVQKAQELKGRVVWVPTSPQGLSGSLDRPTIALVRALNLTAVQTLLIMELYANILNEPISGATSDNGSVVRLIAPEEGKRIVYSTNTDELATTYGHELPAPGSSIGVEIDGKDMLSVGASVPVNNWMVVANIPVSELVRDVASIRNVTVIMSIVSAIIAAAIGLLVMWSVGRPLGKLRNLMNEGEKGNLTVRSDIRQRDEIGQVAESFNRMMDQIKALVQQTNRSAEEVLDTAANLTEASRKTATSAKEIAIATEEIAKGATNLAMESERGTEMTSHIGKQVQAVIRENEEMGRAAAIVEESGRRGADYMAAMLEKTGRTEDMTRSMMAKVDKLKESTGSIRKILDVLNNIMKQTNILSLNATIEAARAGAAGKGFMVVADEIRKLADQSRQSIGVVGEIVETIQREIDETVTVLSAANPLFQEQIESVRNANQIFADVQARMNDFVQRLESATAAVARLEEAQAALNLAMTNVSAVAQESSATSEEVASLSSEQQSISEELVRLSNRLESVSRELRESLSRFTI